MKPFEYVTASTPASAADLVADGGKYLGGGIDLLGEMKEYLAEPKRLVNIKALPGTHEIKEDEHAWNLGANVAVAQIAAHAGIQKKFPGLATAAGEVGSPQIRNVATLGGNLAQHSRCWYYRHCDVHCLKKGGDVCFALDGENKIHSLFTGCTCVSPVVSNLATILQALEAKVSVLRAGKQVQLTIPELYHGAWVDDTRHNSLGPGDLILGVEIPVAQDLRCAYLQMSEKHEFDWALVSCAAAGLVKSGKLHRPRLVLGVVAPIPYAVQEADQFLEGKSIDDSTAAAAADILLKNASPLEHNGYKIPLARALIRRTLLKLVS